jgi:hypothetical protein
MQLFRRRTIHPPFFNAVVTSFIMCYFIDEIEVEEETRATLETQEEKDALQSQVIAWTDDQLHFIDESIKVISSFPSFSFSAHPRPKVTSHVTLVPYVRTYNPVPLRGNVYPRLPAFAGLNLVPSRGTFIFMAVAVRTWVRNDFFPHERFIEL